MSKCLLIITSTGITDTEHFDTDPDIQLISGPYGLDLAPFRIIPFTIYQAQKLFGTFGSKDVRYETSVNSFVMKGYDIKTIRDSIIALIKDRIRI